MIRWYLAVSARYQIKNEPMFTFIDTSPALPNSVPDSSEFSRDSEDEVQAGIERKRIW